MRLCTGTWVVVSLLLTAGVAAGESQETLVPIDAEGAIDVVDSRLAGSLGLFDDYQGFIEARLYQISDTSFALEVLARPGKSLIKTRRELGSDEVEVLRQTISQRIHKSAPQVVLDQRGRTKMLLSSLVLSLGYYGWAMPFVLDVDDSKSAVALYMITSASGFFIPVIVTRDMEVTDAAATLYHHGASRGIAYGILLDELIAGEGGGDDESRRKIGVGVLASLVSGSAGYVIASRSDMTPGTAEVLAICSDFGLAWGAGTAHLADFYDEDKDRAAAASMLLGTGLGYLSGRLLADRESYTRGDAYVLNTVGLLGTYVTLSAGQLIGADADKDRTIAAMTGSVAGLAAGHRLVRGRDFGTGQGTLIGLSTLAGGLLGLGIAYLIASDDASDNERANLYLGMSSVGAATGFWTMYRSFSGGAYGPQDDSLQSLDSTHRRTATLAGVHRLGGASGIRIPLFRCTFGF